MERIKIITHNNCKIVFFDCKGLKEDDVCEHTRKFTDLGISNQINLFLLDVVGTHTTPKIKDSSAESVKRTNAHFGKAYYALVGLSPMQRLIANLLTKNQYFASSVEDAKNWLASQVK